MDNDTLLASLAAWLETAPGFGAGGMVKRLCIDDTAAVPGSAGLYPQGVQLLYRTQNLLGEATERCRATFTLRLVLPAAPCHNASAAPAAQLLLGFQCWVAAQSAAHSAPVFGNCDTAQESLAASAARLESRSDDGTAVYTVTLKAEYSLKYQATD